MKCVLDNSVAMRWLLDDGSAADRTYALGVLMQMDAPDAEIWVPAVWALEVGNVIARAERQHLLQEARSAEFLSLLDEMAIIIDESSSRLALGAVLQLARRFKLSTYDAAYLELALRLSLPLATLDSDLRRAAKKTGVPVV